MITLHHEKETDFSTNGYGMLDNLFNEAPEGEWELNGVFKISFSIPYFSDVEKTQHLTEENIIQVPVPFMDRQLFRIYRSEKSLGYVHVEARHIFYDLLDNWVEDTNVVGQSGNLAVQQILNNTHYDHRFTGSSNITNTANARVVRMNPVEALLDDSRQNSFVNRWGGELVRDNFHIEMLSRRGTNRGVKIRHKYNLTGYEASFDWSTVITKIRPVGFDGLTLPETFVNSPLMDEEHPKIAEIEYRDVKAAVGEYADDEDAIPLEQAYDLLRELAEQEFSIHHIDEPESTIEVNFIQLRNMVGYEDLQELQEVRAGDTVEVLVPEENFEVTSRLVGFKWNPLEEDEYTSTTLGNHVREFTSSNQGINAIRQEIDDVREQVIVALQSANGRNTNWSGEANPNDLDPWDGLRLGDIYFQENGEYQIMYRYVEVAGERYWREIVNTQNDDEIARIVTEALEEMEQVKQNVESEMADVRNEVEREIERVSGEFEEEFNILDSQLQDTHDRAVQAGLNAEYAREQIEQSVNNSDFDSLAAILENHNNRINSFDGIDEEIESILEQAERNRALMEQMEEDDIFRQHEIDDNEERVRWNFQSIEAHEDRIISTESELEFNSEQMETIFSRIDDSDTGLNALNSRQTQQAGEIAQMVRRTDLDDEIQVIESNWRQTYELIESSVEDLEGNYSSQQQTINSLTTRIGDAEGNITSTQTTVSGLSNTVSSHDGRITTAQQTADGAVTSVGSLESDVNSEFSQIQNNINLMVRNDEVIHQINVSDEGILIDGEHISITGQTDIADAVIDTGHIRDGSITNAKIYSLDANKITGTTGQFQTLFSRIFESNYITSDLIEVDTQLVNELFGVSGFFEELVSRQAFIEELNSSNLEIDFGRVNGTLEYNRLTGIAIDANDISGGTLRGIDIIGNRIQNQFDVEVAPDPSNPIRSQGTLTIEGNITMRGTLTQNQGSTEFIIDAGHLSSSILRPDGSIRQYFELTGSGAYFSDGQRQTIINHDGLLITQNGQRIGEIRMQYFSSTGTNSVEFINSRDNEPGLRISQNRIETTQRTNNTDLYLTPANSGVVSISSANSGTHYGVRARSYALHATGIIQRDSNGRLAIVGSTSGAGSIALGIGTSGSWNDRIRIGDRVNLFADMNMQGHNVLNPGNLSTSDERWKENIQDTEEDSLKIIKSWNFVDFNFREWTYFSNEKRLGLIAQQTPELAKWVKDENLGDHFALDGQKQLMLVSHGLQQVILREEHTNLMASENFLEIETLKDKVKELERELNDLKGMVA